MSRNEPAPHTATTGHRSKRWACAPRTAGSAMLLRFRDTPPTVTAKVEAAGTDVESRFVSYVSVRLVAVVGAAGIEPATPTMST